MTVDSYVEYWAEVARIARFPQTKEGPADAWLAEVDAWLVAAPERRLFSALLNTDAYGAGLDLLEVARERSLRGLDVAFHLARAAMLGDVSGQAEAGYVLLSPEDVRGEWMTAQAPAPPAD